MHGLHCGCSHSNKPYLTAYEIAVRHGFDGTEEEWINSIGTVWVVKVSTKNGSAWTCNTDYDDIESLAEDREIHLQTLDGKTAMLMEIDSNIVFNTLPYQYNGKSYYDKYVLSNDESGAYEAIETAPAPTNIAKTQLASAVQTSLGKADTAYQKPGSGIPSSDMTSAVQTSLGKADTAYQKPSEGIPWYDLTDGLMESIGKADTALQPQADMKNLGGGIAQSTTTGTVVAKTATLSGYNLSVNGIVAVHFTTPVEANATLDINSTGAKPIYYRGAAITGSLGNYLISYNDTATFVYDGTNYNLLAVDSAKPQPNYGSDNAGKPVVVGSDGTGEAGTWQKQVYSFGMTVAGTTYTLTGMDFSADDVEAVVDMAASGYQFQLIDATNKNLYPLVKAGGSDNTTYLIFGGLTIDGSGDSWTKKIEAFMIHYVSGVQEPVITRIFSVTLS